MLPPLCRQIAAAVKAQGYEFDSLVLSVSLPAQLGVREVSPRFSRPSKEPRSSGGFPLHPAALLLAPREEGSEVRTFAWHLWMRRRGLRRPCPLRDTSVTLSRDDVVQVKEAFKWVMQGLLAKELGGVAVGTKVAARRRPRGCVRSRPLSEAFFSPLLQSLFEVGVEFRHPQTDRDCHFL